MKFPAFIHGEVRAAALTSYPTNAWYFVAFSFFKFAVVLSEFWWCSSGLADGGMTECGGVMTECGGVMTKCDGVMADCDRVMTAWRCEDGE
jgi:hypothetical protein